MLSEATIDVTCPSCKNKIQVKVKNLKKGAQIICPKCGVSILLEMKGKSPAEAAKDIDRRIKKMGFSSR